MAGHHFRLLVILGCPGGNRSQNFMTIQKQNHPSTTWSLIWHLLHGSDLRFCLHQEPLNREFHFPRSHGTPSCQPFWWGNHSTSVFCFLHRGVKKKKSSCKFIVRSAVLKPSNGHGSTYLTICFVIHYAFWKWLSPEALRRALPREAFSGAEGRLLSITAPRSEIRYYCGARWDRVFAEVLG